MVTETEIKRLVRERYAQVAQRTTSCCGTEDLSEATLRALKYGYQEEDLKDLPDSVTESFAGCGNPLAIDELKEGEVVLDLGSGAGLDCFLASEKVGERGKVYGLDMTDEMLDKARINKEKLGKKNVSFRKGEMEDMPFDDDSIDVIISNCVINLSPNKDKVFQEAHRVLKPGGRLMVSDIVTRGELTDEIKQDLALWTGCVAGA
ncbi:MAG: arsenite methyltransferase, partial [Candidatus Tectomicrobia bacterium]|nr:arsenite methyltransferase [Candidatus Tectomicrobia bacterium]